MKAQEETVISSENEEELSRQITMSSTTGPDTSQVERTN